MAPATALKVTTPSDTEIELTREFNAPRELVFRVFTDPKQGMESGARELYERLDELLASLQKDAR